MLHLVFTHKVRHIAYPRATEGINALVVVPHSKHCATVLCNRARELFDPCVLQFIGVLKLINQDMAKASAVMFTDRIVIAQEFVGTQHELTKIHHSFTLALGFIEFVQLYFFTRVWVAHIDIFGA